MLEAESTSVQSPQPKPTLVQPAQPNLEPLKETSKAEPKTYIEPEPIINTQTETVVQSEPEPQFESEPSNNAPLRIEEGLAKAKYTFKPETGTELGFRKVHTSAYVFSCEINEHLFDKQIMRISVIYI